MANPEQFTVASVSTFLDIIVFIVVVAREMILHIVQNRRGRSLYVGSRPTCSVSRNDFAHCFIFSFYFLLTYFLFAVQKKLVVFEEKCANAVAWNTQMEEMLCFTGNGMLNIKVSSFPLHRQNFQGYVVGLQGSRLFCLHELSMQVKMK